MKATLHTKEELKELCKRQDYIEALTRMQLKFDSVTNLKPEVERNQLIVDAKLNKHQHLVGTRVGYKGIVSNEVRKGKITKIMYFTCDDVSVRIDYDTNGFDWVTLSDLVEL